MFYFSVDINNLKFFSIVPTGDESPMNMWLRSFLYQTAFSCNLQAERTQGEGCGNAVFALPYILLIILIVITFIAPFHFLFLCKVFCFQI